MKQVLPHPLADIPDNLMKRAGYIRHCTQAGRACFHRQLSEDEFPRFHAYVTLGEQGMEVDLHIDQFDTLKHKGNHDKEWAYFGGRVTGEMRRVFEIFKGEGGLGKVNQPTSDENRPKKKKTRKEKKFV